MRARITEAVGHCTIGAVYDTSASWMLDTWDSLFILHSQSDTIADDLKDLKIYWIGNLRESFRLMPDCSAEDLELDFKSYCNIV